MIFLDDNSRASIADELLIEDLPYEIKSVIDKVFPTWDDLQEELQKKYQDGYSDGSKEFEGVANHEMIVELREMLRERINSSTELEDILDKLKQIEEQYT
jgi:cell fate (sporulation/competence/biofilm development) regulator YlbF (YheA/YmcA/DUF963 family)